MRLSLRRRRHSRTAGAGMGPQGVTVRYCQTAGCADAQSQPDPKGIHMSTLLRLTGGLCILLALASAADAEYQQQMHLYSYVSCRPTRMVDPSGAELKLLAPKKGVKYAKAHGEAHEHLAAAIKDAEGVNKYELLTEAMIAESKQERDKAYDRYHTAGLIQSLIQSKDIKIEVSLERQKDAGIKGRVHGSKSKSENLDIINTIVKNGTIHVKINPMYTRLSGWTGGHTRQILYHELLHAYFALRVAKKCPTDHEHLDDEVRSAKWLQDLANLKPGDVPKGYASLLRNARRAGKLPKRGDNVRLDVLQYCLSWGYEPVVEELADGLGKRYYVTEGPGKSTSRPATRPTKLSP